ncbi:hypothetical protein N7462_004960 [Penicillium macrosclerotiorum]|uniref:uncharacterized protein n=1 Tax=Penicillium macrosclerotiorum TaxID=303699 RepID=UPI0025494297|nr:uncharacterized protein N7462_004960 [Penicillium macrosclerotiorum]KAJ5690568.1 hypothetical protein N7462_004960 [Penicillium macrosclerotiorum]
MLRSLSRPFSLPRVKRSPPARRIHQITTNFVTRDKEGNLTTDRVPVFIGKNPTDAFVNIETTVGQSFRDSRPNTSEYFETQERCKILFYHATQHFGFAEFAERTGVSLKRLKPILDSLAHM